MKMILNPPYLNNLHLKILSEVMKYSDDVVNLTLFKLLPYLDDYTHPWIDEILYSYFNLTGDKIKEIEQEIK